MTDSSRQRPDVPLFRRLWKPVAATGAGGAAIAAWFDDLIFYADEILGLILLPILAGVIFLLDVSFFRSRMPNRDSLGNPVDRGANK